MLVAERGFKQPRDQREPRQQARYYLLSNLFTPAAVTHIVRSHWGVENQVHWVLDVVFNEDQSRNRSDNSPSNLAVLRKLALNALRNNPLQSSIRRKQRRAARDDQYRTQLLVSCP